MEENSWQNTIMALALLVVSALGSSRTAADVPKTNAGDSPNSSTAAALADIAGKYDVVGTNEDGNPYKGELEVIKHGDAYQFRWSAGNQYNGVGVKNDGVVAVAFTSGSDGKGCGVVSYRVVNNMLDGKWAYWGLNETGREKATRTTGNGLPGTYEVQGKNPNGNAYKGTLTIASSAGGYKFNWSNGSDGFGIQQGDNISVGIGGPRCAFVAYEIKADGMLDGVWGGYGSNKTGTQKARKK